MFRRLSAVGQRRQSGFATPSLRSCRRWYSTPVGSGVVSTDRFKIPKTEPIGVTLSAKEVEELNIEQDHIRNFSIIAHIDHGKTTLSDAILRRTGVLPADGAVGTYMDKLDVERERGITVKAQTASMFVKLPPEEGRETSETFLLNLIDTPGHVDFSYEVSRSLSASDGAVLLVDCTQGVEAQTMANLYMAMEHNLTIIPALSKLDAALHAGQIEQVLLGVEEATGEEASSILFTSARQKLGIEALLKKVIASVKPPQGNRAGVLRALIFDAWTAPVIDRKGNEEPGGVVCLCRICDGSVQKDDIVSFFHNKKKYQVKEVGIMYPERMRTKVLRCGQVGYIHLSVGTRADAQIGDTITTAKEVENIEAIPGFKIVKPVVFAGFFPGDGQRFSDLEEAAKALIVNDPSVTVKRMACPALGAGLQLGFLGMLHMSVFQDRLLQEHQSEVLVTPAQVAYKYTDKQGNMHDLSVYAFKQKHEGAVTYHEPFVNVTVVLPSKHYGDVSAMAMNKYRSIELDQKMVDAERIMVRFKMPLAEMISGFFTDIKSTTHGYGHLEYDDPFYEEADLVKLDIMVNKKPIEALSLICNREFASRLGKQICTVLKENIPAKVTELPIQACVGGKIVARETLGKIKSDVTAKLHAADPSRYAKKLGIQKKQQDTIRRNLGDVTIDQSTLQAAMGARVLK